VVVKVRNGSWQVIDGQQRLTTIYILLSCLGKTNEYTIEYETRTGSKDFLEKIDERKAEENIDYFHIVEAKKQIEKWFENKNDDDKNIFTDALLNDVKFIWYETDENDPIKVFTRLNVGKISLTNAELIKALFLNKSNFADADYQKIRLQQQEIAMEWDTIEYTLQKDEFWLFLNKNDYEKPTRIDFIFDLICEKDILKVKDKSEFGADDYRTFRYFYIWFNENSKKIKENSSYIREHCWQKVKTLFQTFQEWFDDLELYHYIGFLIENNKDISKIMDEWNKPGQTKENFLSDYIIAEIKKMIPASFNLEKQYDDEGQSKKTTCRPILLLHNIQTVINQNKALKENEKYRLPAFYKFPFHLYKKEKWDVEHIDSNTENDLEKESDKKVWLQYARDYVSKEIQDKIDIYLNPEINNEKTNFEVLKDEIFNDLEHEMAEELKLNQEEKNQLWNFVLLDAGTNRGYGNAIFPAKRKIIIDKDRQGTFIPDCTKNVFAKYYNTKPNNLLIWDKNDAEVYLKNIETTLEKFLKQKGENHELP
jgi:hypothetical protein